MTTRVAPLTQQAAEGRCRVAGGKAEQRVHKTTLTDWRRPDVARNYLSGKDASLCVWGSGRSGRYEAFSMCTR
jgi:hypothetical protein